MTQRLKYTSTVSAKLIIEVYFFDMCYAFIFFKNSSVVNV